MARRSKSRSSGGFGGMGGMKGLATKAAAGVGVGLLLASFVPQLGSQPLVKHGAAFLFGGVPGVAASVLLNGGLGSITGGASSSQTKGATFA